MKRQTPKEFLRSRVNLEDEAFEQLWNDLGNFVYYQAQENGAFNDMHPALVFRGVRNHTRPITGFPPVPAFTFNHPGDCLGLHMDTPVGEPYGVYAEKYKDE